MYINEKVTRYGVSDNGMSRSGIKQGDIITVREQDTAENGDIIIVMFDGENGGAKICIRRMYKEGTRILLVADNPAYPPLFFNKDDITIIGKVVGVFHEIA